MQQWNPQKFSRSVGREEGDDGISIGAEGILYHTKKKQCLYFRYHFLRPLSLALGLNGCLASM